ncbi:glycoside hydrolase family 2 TIM barrel-domain containing protein [Pseudoflavonifractor sp. CLA-AP-H29]|uniref:Glycoside hydrolase family 2 TIM barrel-domain containing protein n=1 Tax=Pseudoflavonifractor intestinihominis TaxID=3133171 RepID=A0ABV1EG51_9FIRM
MPKLPFNSDWFVSRMGEEDKSIAVTLPHDAMLSEPRTAQSAGGTNTGWFEGYDYVYQKAFNVPAEWADRAMFLEFEGVYRDAEVFVNDSKAAFQPGGYTGFFVALDGLLRTDSENHIRVISRNADQPNSRWYSGAGIYRPVWLHVLPKEHIALNGLKIQTLHHVRPSVRVALSLICPGTAQVSILDGDRELAQAACKCHPGGTVDIPLPDAELWSPDTPKCYTCRVAFGEDVREETFGIRTVACDSKNGFCINGERVILRGACVHHDNGILGAITLPDAELRKVRLLKQAGYNAIRSAHNPCSKALLDACDRLGMLVLDEYADMWYIHKTRYDYASLMPDNWKNDLRDLVDKDFNHPSVVMYSIGNEVSETAQKRGIELTGQMTEYLHQLDSRPVTCGINIFFNFLSSLGLGVYSDKKAEKSAPSGGTSAKKKAVGSEFFNNLAGLFGSEFMKFGATLHGSDVKTRDAFAKLDVAGYNYGEKRYVRDLKKYPDRVILGSETFCADAARFWDLAKKHPALIGDFVWTGMDYLGEVGLGAMEYRDYAPDFDHGPGWITASAGVLDLTGASTGQTAYTQVAFELSPIRIGVVPADHAFEPHSPSAWRMSNTYESWAWNGCEGKETRVEVYARGAKVALFLNGKPMGEKKPDRDSRAVFRVTWQPGELTAVVYGADGAEVGRTSLSSAGEETRLAAEPEEPRVSAEGLCYVRLRYTDENGLLKPLARGDIRVAVEGGRLLALGSACPYNERGYLTDTTDTYYGQALAIVKPKGPGELVLRAESPYGSAQVHISCREEGAR